MTRPVFSSSLEYGMEIWQEGKKSIKVEQIADALQFVPQVICKYTSEDSCVYGKRGEKITLIFQGTYERCLEFIRAETWMLVVNVIKDLNTVLSYRVQAKDAVDAVKQGQDMWKKHLNCVDFHISTKHTPIKRDIIRCGNLMFDVHPE